MRDVLALELTSDKLDSKELRKRPRSLDFPEPNPPLCAEDFILTVSSQRQCQGYRLVYLGN